MPLNYPLPGEGYAAAYQISSTPFVTSSTVSQGQIKTIEFDRVSRFLILKNTGPASSVVSVAFTSAGLLPQNSNYFFLSGSESFSAELRTKKLFISGSSGTANFTLVAGLTYIPATNMLDITGSNGYSGVG